jgi:hypothetical protein
MLTSFESSYLVGNGDHAFNWGHQIDSLSVSFPF